MTESETEVTQGDTAQDPSLHKDVSTVPVMAYQESEEDIHPIENGSVLAVENANTAQSTANGSPRVQIKDDLPQVLENTSITAPTTNSSDGLPGLVVDHTTNIIPDSKHTPELDAIHSEAKTIMVDDATEVKVEDPEETPNAVPAQETIQIKRESPEPALESVSLENANQTSTTTEPEILDAEMVLQAIPLQAEQNEDSMAPEVEYDSSAEESSSDDSLSSDSDDSDDSAEDYELLDPIEQARRLMEGDGSDDEGGKTGAGEVLRTVNEKADEAVEIPDIKMTPETKIEELGKVEAVIDNMILIKAKTSGEYQVLESGSALCTTDRVIIGVVAETLGRVQEPLYCVRFNNPQTISGFGIERDTIIYYVPEHSYFVFTQALQGVKGSDASNLHDEEVGRDEIEFSDDEAEAQYKKQKKLQKMERQGPRGGSFRGRGDARRGAPRDREHESFSPLSYDDVQMEDQLYTPLVRPASMNTPGQHTQHNMSHDGYSRGAGGTRGFGNRGRGGNRGRANGNHNPNGRQQTTTTQGMPSQGFQPQQSFQFPATNSQLQPQYPVQGFQMSQLYDQLLRGQGQFPAPQHTSPSQYDQANQWLAFFNAQQSQQLQQSTQQQQQSATQQQYAFQGHQNVLPPGVSYNPAFSQNQTGKPPG